MAAAVMIAFLRQTIQINRPKEDTSTMRVVPANNEIVREDISEYVAQLQLHMALQARNLLPSLINASDSREKFLQETQATIEKLVSRQTL
jgi:hypothetical protein